MKTARSSIAPASCGYDIFAAAAEDFVLFFLRAKTSLAESGHRTRTRTAIAGTACSPSSKRPAFPGDDLCIERPVGGSEISPDRPPVEGVEIDASAFPRWTTLHSYFDVAQASFEAALSPLADVAVTT